MKEQQKNSNTVKRSVETLEEDRSSCIKIYGISTRLYKTAILVIALIAILLVAKFKLSFDYGAH